MKGTRRGTMDLSKFKELKDLEALLELMGRHDLAELKLESDGRAISFRKTEPHVVTESFVPAVAPVAHAPAADAAGAAEPADGASEVTSPLVGSFYRSPSPEAEPFVREGDRVEADSVLGIIEAMKVMNPIAAHKSGTLKKVLINGHEPVEFEQSLMVIE